MTYATQEPLTGISIGGYLPESVHDLRLSLRDDPQHPASSVHQTIPRPLLRRLIMGIATGLTAISII